ncbi:hypothetical protein [Asaia sp. VD9]|uniref:hypothetical protein n=1 Tax=Asaia sp. VD9 TaxID=3081235 RepID=UPI00301782C9
MSESYEMTKNLMQATRAGISSLFQFAGPAEEYRVVSDAELRGNVLSGVGQAFRAAMSEEDVKLGR